MLTEEEKQTLYKVIAAAIGEDAYRKTYVPRFNDATVSVVEEMLSANAICNKHMRELVADLAGASAHFTKGWLKRVLRGGRDIVQTSNARGYGCAMSVKSRWKTPIVMSTF